MRGAKLIVAFAALAIFPAAYLVQPYLSDTVSVCFFRTMTGYRCPFCGLTHALAAAMHGHFRAAQWYHPLWWIAPVLLIWIATAALLDAGFGTDYLKPFRAIKTRASWRCIGAIVAVFWIANALWGKP